MVAATATRRGADSSTVVLTLLGEAVDQVRGCDLSAVGGAGLEAVVDGIRELERVTAGLLNRALARAQELADRGEGPGPAALAGGVAATTARAEAARAEVARALPLLGAALARGEVGVDHLDTVATVFRKADDAGRAALAALDPELTAAAGRLSVSSFDRHVHRVMARRRDRRQSSDGEPKPEPEPEPERSEIRWWWGRDNVGHLTGRFTAEQYERLDAALTAEMSDLVRRADGAAEVVEGVEAAITIDGHLAAEAMLNRLTGEGRGRLGRPALTIVVDAQTVRSGSHPATVRETASGGPLRREVLDRCACDAVVRTVTLDSRGVPVDVGRAQRTATDAQWAALTALYSSCAWYGCDRPISWCQAHHVVWWEHLGPTDLANLAPLCHRHHHLVHEGGWGLVLHPDRRLDHLRPDGTLWRTSHPDRSTLSATHGQPGPDGSGSIMSGTDGQPGPDDSEREGDTGDLAA